MTSAGRKPVPGPAARPAGAAAACLLVCLAVAAPAHADLPPGVAVMLNACLDPDLDRAARVAAARGAGWVDLSAADRTTAAAALAPWALLRRLGLDGADALEPAEFAADLAVFAGQLDSVIAARLSSDDWMSLPDAAGAVVGRIVDYVGDGRASECELSVVADADAVARALDLSPRRLERRSMTLALWDLPHADPADRGAIITHIRLSAEFAPRAGAAGASIVLTPRLPRGAAGSPRTP